jgi:hypothetical protein
MSEPVAALGGRSVGVVVRVMPRSENDAGASTSGCCICQEIFPNYILDEAGRISYT